MTESYPDREPPRPATDALDRGAGSCRGSVLIVSASIGAGHDGAAEELGRRLRDAGLAVRRVDFLDLLPARCGAAVRGGYHTMLTAAPWLYQRVYATTARSARPGIAVRALLRATEHRMLRAVPAGAAAVVSTYPGASQVLGALRSSGRLAIPAFTYLTDFSVHPLWVAPGVDAHLAAHALPCQQARVLRAARTTVTGPVVDPRFRPGGAAERAAARRRFGLPPNTSLALLVAGSWGVGAMARAAHEIAASGVAVPVAVCGRNKALARRLRADGLAHAFDWVTEMPALMRAADVLVQNAGGLTSLEAFASGLPVASYRCIPGHGQANAAALHDAGLAAWIRRPEDLAAMLGELLHGARGPRQRGLALRLFRGGHDPVSEVLGLTERCPTASVAGTATPPGTAAWRPTPQRQQSSVPRPRREPASAEAPDPLLPR